jgi:dihydroxy-acid dehydratase
VHSAILKEALAKWNIVSGHVSEEVKTFYKAGPAGIQTQTAFSQSTRWPSLDADRANGCVRDL